MFLLSDDHTLLPPAPPGDYFFLEKGGGLPFLYLCCVCCKLEGIYPEEI